MARCLGRCRPGETYFVIRVRYAAPSGHGALRLAATCEEMWRVVELYVSGTRSVCGSVAGKRTGQTPLTLLLVSEQAVQRLIC